MNSQPTTEQPDFTESVQSIIVEQTDNGRTIVEFLISAVNGEFPDFQPCHKLEAARLLEKYGHGRLPQSVGTLTGNLNLPQPTRRERRDSRRADRRIHLELAQIVQEETDNGRTIVTFLVQAMEGELTDFKPCHRMSAAKELLHRGSQYTLVEEEEQAEPEPEESESERAEREERERREREREEHIEYSLHGPVYYETYPWPCVCEYRERDCEGNELSGEKLEEALTKPPARRLFLRYDDTLEAFKERYRDYLARRSARFPDDPVKFDRIRWKRRNRDP